jgi:AAHS family cis,cis-muconate transporter-like MFS transporter
MEASANILPKPVTSTGSKTVVFILIFLSLVVDGYDLVLVSYCLTSLRTDFGLSSFQAGSLGSLTLAAMVVGGLYGGWASDRYGRVKVIVWSILVFSLGTPLLGFTENYWQFAVVRFFSSMGIGALYMSSNTLMSEYVTGKYRNTILGTMLTGWTIGYLMVAVLAGMILPIHGWRWLCYIAVTPILLALLIHWLIPEPTAWIESRARKLHEAVQLSSRKGAWLNLPKGWDSLLSDVRSRRYFIFWSFAAGFLQFGFYGVNNWMPSYLEKELHMDFKVMTGYMVGTYLATIFGKILAGVSSDYFGRRVTMVVGTVGTAILLPVIVYTHTPENTLYLLVFFGFLYGIPHGVLGTYMTESFPTSIRGTAVGGAYNVGRIGAALAPVTIGMLAAQGSIGLGFLVMGGAYFLAGMIPALFIKDRLHDPQKAV